VKQQDLSQRVDVFVEEEAFGYDLAKYYLEKAQQLGFDITVHADQFSKAGSYLAAEVEAKSADHLEASDDDELKALIAKGVGCVVLPGASLGLGMQYGPARRI